MKILRLSTLSLTLAIAVFSLGYVNPSFAGKPDSEGNHDHGGEGNTETTFTVDIKVGSNITDPPRDCTGTTEKGLSVGFLLDNCRVTLNDFNVPFGIDDYCLFAVDVKNTRKETSVMFFFHNPCGEHPGTGVWRTLRLPATVKISVGNEPGVFRVMEVFGSFQDVVLTKNHQPYKEVPLTDTITVGDIVYKEPPP